MRFSLPARFLLIFCFLMGAMARAETPAQVENPLRARRSWVADGAGVVGPEWENKINALLNRLEKRNGSEIAVVTVHNLGGQSIESFAGDLFGRWKIGKKGRDNGVLILAAIDDHRYRIEVGSGLARALPDAKATALMRNALPAAFRRGEFGEGLYQGALAVARVLTPQNSPRSASERPSLRGAPHRQNAAPRPFSPSVSHSSVSHSSIPHSSIPHSSIPRSSSYPAYPSRPAVSPGFSGFWLFLPLLGGAAVLGTVLANRPPRCEKCRGEMDQLSDAEVRQSLSAEQQFEEDIGSRDYQIWKCKTCAHQQMRVVSGGRSLGRCPRCNLYSLSSRTQTLQLPTETQTGLEETTEECLWPRCRYSNRRERTLARRPSSHSLSSSPSGSSHSSNGGGPSDFGGGKSSGGGGSGSW